MEQKQLNWDDKIQLGEYNLSNRIFMSALTRQRCPINGVPTPMVAEYYAQRASAAVIFTQTTAWCARGRSSAGSANLYTQEHAQGWKLVTDAVHSKGGRIFVQINHAGRNTNQQQTFGLQPWAPSAVGSRQKVRYLGGVLAPVPKQMTLQDIKETQQEFRRSMKLAKDAGFDGIQLEGAHGYLIDEFLRTCTNQRTDQYGGSVENRARFCLELYDIALQFFKPYQLGIKISPVSRAKDMFDEKPQQTFGYLLKKMSQKQIGHVQIRQSTEPYNFVNNYGITSKEQIQNVTKTLRPYFKGLLIGNDSFNRQKGIAKIRSGDCDAISFGQLFITNPDLADRIINNYECNTNFDKSTFYGNSNGSKGYTDYPPYKKPQE